MCSNSFKGEILVYISFIILFWSQLELVYMSSKKHKSSHTVRCCSSVFPLCLKPCVLAPVSLRPPSWISSLLWLVSSHTHTLASTANRYWAAVLNQFVHARHKSCICVTWWRRVWCQKVTELKVGLLTRPFRCSVSCGREDPLSGADLLNFWMHRDL